MMRVLQAALLAGIPMAGLAASPLLDRIQADREPVVATMVAPALSITGAPARVSVLSAALDGLAGEVSLETVSCSESVSTESRQTRYTAGVRRSDNPEHTEARLGLDREIALLAELQVEAEVVSAEVEAMSAQLRQQEAMVAGLGEREASLQADWQRASASTAEAADRVSEAADAAAELRHRAEHRDALTAEIANLEARLPGLHAAMSAARSAADAVDLDAIQQEVTRSAGLVEVRQRGVKSIRAQVKQTRRAGGDVEAARVVLKDARAQLAQAEDRLSAALAATIAAEGDLARADDTRRQVLHTATALRHAQDDLSVAPGHCSILAGKADKLPRLERKLGHREAEEHGARIALNRASSLHHQQSMHLAESAQILHAQDLALAALEAGIAGQSEQVARSQGALSDIPARLSRTVRRDLDYPVETWTRSCEVFASVHWTDANGLHTEHLTTLAVTSDVASPGAPEAGIEADLRMYPLPDDALIRQADLALADDIRVLLTDGGLADLSVLDTGR
ncbi:MAG: hypothetical protein ACI8RZ_006210 [Myxococcota bacterium]|jgi:hypothetical protein